MAAIPIKNHAELLQVLEEQSNKLVNLLKKIREFYTERSSKFWHAVLEMKRCLKEFTEQYSICNKWELLDFIEAQHPAVDKIKQTFDQLQAELSDEGHYVEGCWSTVYIE